MRQLMLFVLLSTSCLAQPCLPGVVEWYVPVTGDINLLQEPDAVEQANVKMTFGCIVINPNTITVISQFTKGDMSPNSFVIIPKGSLKTITLYQEIPDTAPTVLVQPHARPQPELEAKKGKSDEPARPLRIR